MISVIVPTYNRNDLLNECLIRLSPARQTLNSSEYEVIVMDDSKDNRARQLVEGNHAWATCFSGPKKGPAANRNQGAKNAKGDWLVFIDDDCLPLLDLLQNYYEVIVSGKYRALEGAIISEREKQKFNEEAPLNTSGGNFWSCNIAVEKNTFLYVNGFDEGFPYAAMEDTDLYERIKQVTTPFFVRNAEVIHPWRTVLPFKSYRKWLESSKYFLKKTNAKKNFSFRVLRVKLLIGSLIGDVKELRKYSFKGSQFLLERLWFNFLMIFI